MNSTIGKFAKWYVRVVDPKIIPYKFWSRGEEVSAERFECIVVSKDPTQYMLATVPFSFTDRMAAKRALERFKSNDVLEITTPAFDAKARQEFNGCPVKTVLLLVLPTNVRTVPITHTQLLGHPAQGLQVSLQITELVKHLRESGAAKTSRTFDFCGKYLGTSERKITEKTPGKRHTVSEATFVDAVGGKVAVSLWDEANQLFEPLETGVGLLVLGCNATIQDNEVKLNIWPGTHISTSGEHAQFLTRFKHFWRAQLCTYGAHISISGREIGKVCVRGRAANVRCGAGRCYGLPRSSDFSD